MPLSTKVAPLIKGRKYGLAISDLIEQHRAKAPATAEAFNSIADAVNDLYRSMAQPSEVTEFSVTDPLTGERIAWIGGQAVGNISYSGAAFARVWIGPNADPATAPFFSDGQSVVIGKNGVVLVQDMGGNTGASLGVTQESAKAITATSNASPDVVTINAHGYINGDTVLVAGATGDTAINGYRIVQNVTTNTFTMLDLLTGNPVNGNGAYTGGGTATRYYAGGLFQTFAVGPSFSDFRLRGFADGSLKINGASFTLNLAGVTTTISNSSGIFGTAGLRVENNVGHNGVTVEDSGVFVYDTAGAPLVECVTSANSGNLNVFTQGGAGAIINTDGVYQLGGTTVLSKSGISTLLQTNNVWSLGPFKTGGGGTAGVSGTFKSGDAIPKTVTVTNGIITSIV